jgi:hypothetical protein
MIYDVKLKEKILDILEDKISNTSNNVAIFFNEGYIPDKNKAIIINWASILTHAYENIDVLTKEQHIKLDILYNKIMKLQ